MAGNFRLVYPTNGRLKFDGGLNNKFERSIINDNESPDCKNVRFVNGAVGTREGTQKFNTTAIGSFVGDYLGVRHDSTGSETMVAGAGGSFYYASGTAFVQIPSSVSLFTAGIRFGSDEAEGQLFLGNGGQIPYKYNGTEFTRHGIYPPTSTPTVTSSAAGVLTGDYRYKITNVNTNLVESDVGPASTTFTAAAAKLTVTLQTFAVSYGVAYRKVYRTAAGGSTFKLVTTVSDHTTTSYEDNTADGSLGANAPTDAGVPPKYNVIKFHKGRMFCNDTSNLNYIWYSEANNPYTFASTNFIRVGDKSGDIVTGIEVFNDSIVVFCKESVHFLFMQDSDPTNWVLQKINTAFGSRSPYGCFNFNDSLMYPAFQNGNFIGFAEMKGLAIKPNVTFLTTSSAISLLASDPIEPDMFEVQKAYAGNISAIVWKNQAYIAVTHGSLQTQNNRVWVYAFPIVEGQKAAWSPDTGIYPAQFCVYNGKLYFISSTANGFVYEYEAESVYSDDGTAIDSYFWTKEFSPSGENQTFNDFRYVKMLIDKAGGYDMDLVFRLNSDSGSGDVERVSLDPGSSLWGTMVWGSDTWGGGSDQEDVTVFLGAKRGERIQFKFGNQNTANQRFTVHGLRFFYNRKGFR